MRNAITTFIIIFSLTGMSGADIVKLDLFDLGCPTEFNFDSPYWQTDFDLGVEFVKIDSVYMDWSGEITGGLAVKYDPRTLQPVGEPFPINVGIGAYLETPPSWRHTRVVSKGGATYPDPEPFDLISEFEFGTMLWSPLFDGRGTITLDYLEAVGLYSGYVEHGFVNLTKANLVVDGTIVPEPAAILLLWAGIILVRIRNCKS